MSATRRVRRPPGVTLAVLAVAVLFGLRPLVEMYFLHRLDATAEEAFIFGGVEISTWAWLEAGFGVAILLLCLLTWLGRPAWIRWPFIAAVLVSSGVNLYRAVEAWQAELDPIFGGQLQSSLRSVLVCQLPALILVPLYIVWYLNRAPARAFFRQVPIAPPASPRPAGEPPLGGDQLINEK